MRRRGFLAGTALTVLLPACTLPVIPRRPVPTPEAAAGWIRHAQGRYTLHLPRVEMGQHVATTLKQVACDELGADWDAVDVVCCGTVHIARVKATVGSESIRDYALPLARACATLRDALRRGEGGAVLRALDIPAAELRSLSGRGRWTGKAAPLVHGREIVTGGALYTGDMRLPGMLYARVLRAPASPEIPSQPQAWDEAAARAVPGFAGLLQDGRLRLVNADGLAIAAYTPGALRRVEAALAVSWRIDATTTPARLDLDRQLAAGALAHVREEGAPAASPHWDVDLRLEVPAAPHNAMEPRCALARRDASGCTLWSAAQDPFYARDVVARALDLPQDAVRVHGMRAGGAFGGRTLCNVEVEAAVLSDLLRRPVKVQWTRAQELQQGFHRPPSSHRIRARVQAGHLAGWWHALESSHILFTGAGMPPWMQRIADVVGDAGTARGSWPPYRCDHKRVEYTLTRLQVLAGPWRGLGAGPNTLAIESAMDECALVAGIDPLAFRLAHIEDPRLAGTLSRVARSARWTGPQATRDASRLRARGLACGIYKETSYAAAIAEVEIDRTTGEIEVRALWCAHDCGRVLNPDQVRAQTEGNLVWSIGLVLVEALPFRDGAVGATSFAEAPIPRITQLGALHVDLVESTRPPSGAGETAIVAGAGAIANALRHATGHRFARMPVRAQDVLAALRD